MKPTKAVIFDMEGVLIYSQPYIWQAREEYLAPYGIERIKEDAKSMIGLSLKDQLAKIENDYGIKIDFNDFSAVTAHRQWALMQGKDFTNTHAQKLIKELKAKGIKVAVCSHNIKSNIEKGLKATGLTGMFDAVITIEDVKKHKPEPDSLLLTAETLGVKPEDCVVVEDSPKGIEAAKRAGMRTIGIRHDFNSLEEFKQTGADLILQSFDEVSFDLI